jgi:hypothetical protein
LSNSLLEPCLDYHFGRTPVYNQGSGTIQLKPTIGSPGDRYEQEADRIASQVMMPAPSIDGYPPDMAPTPVQIRRTQSMERVPRFHKDLENQLGQRRGEGSPLPGDVRAILEPRFGFDFSLVRVHRGSEVGLLNRKLAAQAFTHGSNIYFGDGKYDPDSVAGRHLLAHELTHVVQQAGGVQTRRFSHNLAPQRQCTACRTESDIQRPLSISPAPELIQRREVCDIWGNCQSVPDEEDDTIPPSSSPGGYSSAAVTEPPPTLRSPGAQGPNGTYTPNPNVRIEPGKPSPSQPYQEPAPRSWPNAPDTLRSPEPKIPLIPGGIAFGPALAGVAAGLATFFWSRRTAPAWMDETNPITRKPYRSQEEYDEVHSRRR